MALTESEKRLIQLMSGLSPREVSKKTPRVRAAFKRAKAKQKSEATPMTAAQDRKDQERKLRGQ